MKKEIINALRMTAVVLWLAVSLVFTAIVWLPMCTITRPIVRWAFGVNRACVRQAFHHYMLTTSNEK